MGFPIFYSKMHVSVDDMTNLIQDIEDLTITHMRDFHPTAEGAVLTTTYGSSSQMVFEDIISPSLTVYISGGVSYTSEFNRIDTKIQVIGESQTSTSSTSVDTTNPIVSVDGVFSLGTFAGINYALGGSFDAIGKSITLGSTLPSHPQVVYVNYERIPTYTFTDAPTGVAGTGITRIDLLYLEHEKTDTEPFSIDFITANRRLIQEVKYTRRIDGFQIKTIQGTQVVAPNVAVAPSIPSGSITTLCYVHHRNNTTAIYDTDTGNSGESWIEDIRNTI